MQIRHEIDLTFWQRFRLWVESDAAALQMDLASYYGACASVGAIQGLSMARAWGWL